MLLTDSEAARVRDPRPSLSPSRETASLRARACAVSLAIEEEEGGSERRRCHCQIYDPLKRCRLGGFLVKKERKVRLVQGAVFNVG